MNYVELLIEVEFRHVYFFTCVKPLELLDKIRSVVVQLEIRLTYRARKLRFKPGFDFKHPARYSI